MTLTATDTQWVYYLQTYRPEAAGVLMRALDAQKDESGCRTECGPFEVENVNRTIMVALTASPISESALCSLTYFLNSLASDWLEAATALMAHPHASEMVAQQVVHWSKSTAASELAADLGWYYPTAARLAAQAATTAHRPAFGQVGQNPAADPALVFAAQLRRELADAPDQVAAVVRRLGLTWTSSLPALIATARAIVA